MSSRFCILSQLKGCLGRKPFCSFLGFSGAYVRFIVLFVMDKLKEKCKAFCSNRGCLGCCYKSPSTFGLNEPPGEVRKRRDRIAKKPSTADDFWSTSPRDMDLSTRSLSSKKSSQTCKSQNSAGGMANSPEFINHGLILWNQTREHWSANKRTRNEKQVREPRLSSNATYESLLSTNEPFPRHIPLSEMVDFLVDVWEQEGLYD